MSYNTRRAGNVNRSPQINYQNRPKQQLPQSIGCGDNYSKDCSFSSHSGYDSVRPNNAPHQQQQQQQVPSNPLPPQLQQQQPPTQIVSNVKAEIGDSSPIRKSGSNQQILDEKMDATEDGAMKKKSYWMKKGPGLKVSKKIRRRRQNARLRKLLTPKNALMILNELHQGIKFTIQEQFNALGQPVYSVTVDVEGNQHTGQAMSKTAAKQLACENALKALLLEKMGKAVNQAVTGEEQMEEITECEDDNMDSSSVTSSIRSKKPEDEVPWGSLASFALHKLFMEWQSQGIQVPMVPSSRNPIPVPTKATAPIGGSLLPMKKIPEDASTRNPVQLLNQLKPGLQYSEQRDGSPPNHLTFTFTVVVDGQEFVGVASNKKDAKRECARAALAKLGIALENK